MTPPIVILGAGAQGRISAETCLALDWPVAGFLDDTRPVGSAVDGFPVLGPFAEATRAEGLADHAFLVALGDPAARVVSSQAIEFSGRRLATVVHPDARVSRSARLGRGSFVNAFATLFPGAEVGPYSLIDNHASVGVDNQLGTGVFVGPGCQINSGVHCGDGVYLGSGSVLLPGVVVGAGAVVGAGSTVVRGLPAGCVAVGTPARPRRQPSAAPHTTH